MSQKIPVVSRRDVLKIVAAAGGMGLLYRFGYNRELPERTVTESRLLMGTVVNLTLVGGDEDQARASITAVFEQMQRLEAILSRFNPASELSRLNHNGVIETPGAKLVTVLNEAKRISTLTLGAFDVTMKPLLDLYLNAQPSVPSVAELEAVLPLVSYRKLQISDTRISFDTPGMGVTVDGIAKGYIVDQGVDVLRDNGYDHVMVEAGGDLLASGEKSVGQPWRISIRSPRAVEGEFLRTVDLANRAVATSGDYLQSFTSDNLNHHIINPRLGHSDRQLASATVIAPNAMLADALATSMMVMGPADGLALIEAQAGCEVLLVTKDMQIIESAGFSKG